MICYTVVFQKGHGANVLEGNQRFNDLIRSHWHSYDAGEPVGDICDSILETFQWRFSQKKQGARDLVELTDRRHVKVKIHQSLLYVCANQVVEHSACRSILIYKPLLMFIL